MADQPKYAIVNEFDAPQPSLVAQWVPGKGYCYLDRSKSMHDGMMGTRPTAIEDFGFEVIEHPDGSVTFNKTRHSRATYASGGTRVWQSYIGEFTHQRLEVAVVPVQEPSDED